MPYRDSAPHGAPSWIELFSADTDKAEAFYGQLFGWTAEHAGEEYGGYINFHKDGRMVAGCMRNDGTSGMQDAWSVYLAVSDAAATAQAVSTHGGAVLGEFNRSLQHRVVVASVVVLRRPRQGSSNRGSCGGGC